MALGCIAVPRFTLQLDAHFFSLVNRPGIAVDFPSPLI
jgi:hypothetical protein